MGSLIMAIFLVGLGFIAGWRYGYKQVMSEVQRIIDETLNVARRRPRE